MDLQGMAAGQTCNIPSRLIDHELYIENKNNSKELKLTNSLFAVHVFFVFFFSRCCTWALKAFLLDFLLFTGVTLGAGCNLFSIGSPTPLIPFQMHIKLENVTLADLHMHAFYLCHLRKSGYWGTVAQRHLEMTISALWVICDATLF